MPQRVAGAELAVSHVQEVRATDQLPQYVPSLYVRRGILDIAMVHFEVNRHTPVAGYRQDPEQLLQIRTAVLRPSASA